MKVQDKIPHTNLNHLILMPKHYDLDQSWKEMDELLQKHSVFKELSLIEKSISPILSALEKSGLLISDEWFKRGLQEKQEQLASVRHEINQIVNGAVLDVVDEERLHQYWKHKGLPVANSFDALKKYKHLHPTYQLMMTYNNTQNYLKMWEQRLLEKGVVVDGGVLLKGNWRSFSSYTGRIAARNLPLTSMPSAMRDYIVSPIGQQIVSLDLDNAELRLLSHYAECHALKEQFNRGIDVHAVTAKLLRRNMTTHEVSDGQARQLAKQFTYSLLYGAGRQTITKNMQKTFHSITNAEVVALIDEFYEMYPELLVFLEERADSLKLLTPVGEVEPVEKFTRAQKKNYTLQAGVSVAIKLLMTTLTEHGVKVIHVLHDEAWIQTQKNMDLENFLKQVEEAFRQKIKKIFPGLPTKGILTKGKIGGKYNE